MNRSDEKKNSELSLRVSAERQVDNAPEAESRALPLPADKLLHELQVHQIELEMQNEALRHAHRELKATHDRYVDLYEFSPVGYVTLTVTGMIAELNLTVVTLLGVERKHLLHRSFTSLVVAEDQNRWLTLFLNVKSTGNKGSIELALQRRDDAVLQVHIDCARQKVMRSGVPAHGADDTVIRIALSDISERKQAEMLLHESEQHFRTLANCGSALVWTSGLDKLCNYLNEPWLRFTGRSLGQELGDGWAQGVHPDDFDQLWQTYVAAFDRRTPFRVDCRIRRADGSYRWICIDATPRYDCQRSFLGYIGYCTDITERKQAETEIAQNRDRLASFAIEQNRAIEAERKRLAREVHDQIGQVFTAIKLIVNSLPREIFPPGQETALAQALDMGISTTRKITAELRPPLLDDLGFASAVEHFSKQAAKLGNISIEVDIDAQVSLDTTSALTLFRILQESVTNVLRHADATHVAISGRRDGGRYVFCIEDNGRGFAPTDMRVGAMGLKNMQERSRLLGGFCEVSRRSNGGTSVLVSLPLDSNGSDEHPAA